MYCASSPCEVENDVYTTIRDVTAKDNNILLYEVIGSKNVLKTSKPIFVVLFRFLVAPILKKAHYLLLCIQTRHPLNTKQRAWPLLTSFYACYFVISN